MATLDIPLVVLDPNGGWINAPVHVHELHGRPVLLHFWSARSEACRAQFPQLRAWLQAFTPRGLQVVGVHVPSPGQPLARALDTRALEALVVRELGWHHPVAVDDGAVAQVYGVQVVPAYLIFDSQGLLRHRVSGEGAVRHVQHVLERLTGVELEPQPAAY
jgi:peroxiredoxin